MQGPHPPHTIIISSSAFGWNSAIPIEHAREGFDVAPPFRWRGIPEGTRSIALVAEDLDAIVVHWVVYGIPPDVTEIPTGGPLPAGAQHGTNDFGAQRWTGPNPPAGRHRYAFHIYALDCEVTAPGLTMPALMAAIKGHVLAEGEMMGTYTKKGEPVPLRESFE